jgi:uncharacterized protein (DUF3820 family)
LKNLSDKTRLEHGWDYVFTFGKYKGKTVRDVMDENPGYLIWAHESGAAYFTQSIIWEARNSEPPVKKRDIYGDLNFDHDSLDADTVAEYGLDDGIDVWGH